MKILISLFFGFLLACATVQKTIVLSPESDLNAIPDQKEYDSLKKKYSISKKISYGPDPEQAYLSLQFAKKNINYEAPERKVTFTATVWDLPLIKAYLETQKTGSRRSRVNEEARKTLMRDHRRYTQILISVDSSVQNYFDWAHWNIWLEDKNGNTFFPRRTQDTTEEEIILPVDKVVLGKQTKSPGYKVFRHYGTLYFEKLNLPALSPLTLNFNDQKALSQIQLILRVKGNPPVYKVPVDPLPTPAPTKVPSEEKIDQKEQMRLHFRQASDYYKEGQFKEAIMEWQKVLEIDPTHELSQAKIQKASDRLREQEASQEAYTEAQLERKKQVHFLLATEHYKDGNYEEAIEEWEEVLKLDPEHALSKEKIQKTEELLYYR